MASIDVMTTLETDRREPNDNRHLWGWRDVSEWMHRGLAVPLFVAALDYCLAAPGADYDTLGD